MARQGTKSQAKSRKSNSGSRSSSKRRSGSSSGRSASQKPEKYRFAQNVEGQETAAEREYRGYAVSDSSQPEGDPDVLLDVPVVKVDSIHLELDDLQAHVALQAKVLDLVELNVGVDAQLGRVVLDIKGVEAQALLKVRLDHVAAIVDRVLTTLDRNPELLESVGRTVEEVGKGTGHLLGETGEAVESVGEGAEETLPEVGKGAGKAVGEVGEGAGQALPEVGKGAGKAVGEVGEGAGQALPEVGSGAGQAVGDVGEGAGQAVGDVGEGAGQAVGDVGEGAGEAVGEVGQGAGEATGELGAGAGQAVGGVGQAAGGLAGDGQGGAGGLSGGQVAKEAAKHVAKEVGAAASEEAKELGLAATRRVMEMAERRKQRQTEKINATEAAMRTADELDVDLEDVEGTGPEGRITIRDVRAAQGD
jgi:hypothetical protein